MRYKATVAYHGAAYQGWQIQPHGNSVQQEIENVLFKMHKQKIEIVASGRTDAKVHALGQVFHFDSFLDIPEERMKTALNSLLPKDIKIENVEIVNSNFHARFHAKSKRYDYYLKCGEISPFISDLVAFESHTLDIEYMQECAKLFLGEHDFTTFTSSKIDPRKSKVKVITNLQVLKEDTIVHFIFEGNGFLRYMVRMITQTLIEAGKHRISLEDIRHMIEAKDKHLCRYKAEPQGLYLVKVEYYGEEDKKM